MKMPLHIDSHKNLKEIASVNDRNMFFLSPSRTRQRQWVPACLDSASQQRARVDQYGAASYTVGARTTGVSARYVKRFNY